MGMSIQEILDYFDFPAQGEFRGKLGASLGSEIDVFLHVHDVAPGVRYCRHDSMYRDLPIRQTCRYNEYVMTREWSEKDKAWRPWLRYPSSAENHVTAALEEYLLVSKQENTDANHSTGDLSVS